MKLSEQDTRLFYNLMLPLQFFVNQKLRIHNIKCIEDYHGLSVEQMAMVRNALYENIGLIDSFIQENPENFSAEYLAIISEWKKFIKGSFFIERLLSKYAILIQKDEVYGVLGLTQSFEELTHFADLPLYVDTILLPFKGKIVYDGFLKFNNIFFGGGIKWSLKETYMSAKQNNRIIESLEKPEAGKQKKSSPKLIKDWKPELDELAQKANKLKGTADSPAIYTPAFSLVKASIEFAQLAVSNPNDEEGLYRALKKIRRSLNKSDTVLYREDF